MLTKQQQIAEIIYQRPELILVLERLGIYPGVQDKTIEDIAAEQQINADVLMLLLEMQLKPGQTPLLTLSVKDIPKNRD